MTATATTSRTTIGLPVERFAQLKSLAEARDVAPAALVEEWIAKAVRAGDPGAKPLAGYSAWRDDNVIIVEIAGRALPMMKIRDAMKLSIVLDAAAPSSGNPANPFNGNGDFTLSPGAALPINIEPITLIVGRQGRGVVFVIKNPDAGTIEKFAAPTSYAAELANMIRSAIDEG